MAKREVHYFDESGSQNTGETTKTAKKATLGLGLKYVVVASGSGTTGVKVAEEFENSKVKVVVVTEYAGSAEFSEKNKEKLEKLDATVVTSMHAFLSPAESISKIYANHCSENTIIKQVLRRFSQGTKVAAEIVMMATDAGAIPAGEDVVAIAGAGEGADTAIIIKSCHADSFFDKEKGIEFREIIAMPRKKKFW